MEEYVARGKYTLVIKEIKWCRVVKEEWRCELILCLKRYKLSKKGDTREEWSNGGEERIIGVCWRVGVTG
jgi:hypothetical protein